MDNSEQNDEGFFNKSAVVGVLITILVTTAAWIIPGYAWAEQVFQSRHQNGLQILNIFGTDYVVKDLKAANPKVESDLRACLIMSQPFQLGVDSYVLNVNNKDGTGSIRLDRLNTNSKEVLIKTC
jgi:hypothetical protein